MEAAKMMKPCAILILYFAVGLAAGIMITSAVAAQSTELGEDVILECQIDKKAPYHTWFKLTADKQFKVIASVRNQIPQYNEEFMDGRFKILSDKGFHLKISSIKTEDNGIYYCGTGVCNHMWFGPGTPISAKSSKLRNQTQPPALPVHTEVPMTLNYTAGCNLPCDRTILVYSLGITAAVCVALTLVLVCVIFNLTTRGCQQSRGMTAKQRASASSRSCNKSVLCLQDQDAAHDLHYAALDIADARNRGRRPWTSREPEIVYSQVRCQNSV
ncbi:uncharacterized protein LOC139910019 isoform X1 [Centroberyx gerrardi]